MVLLPQILPSIAVLLTAVLTTPTVASLSQSSSSSSLTITIPASNILPNPHVLPPGTHATLTTIPHPLSSSDQQRDLGATGSDEADSSSRLSKVGGHAHILTAPITRSATFVFPSLPSSRAASPVIQSYLLEIRSKEYVFAPYRVDVDVGEGEVVGVWESVRGSPWGVRGAEKYNSPRTGTDASNERKTDRKQKVVVEAKVLARKGFYEERPKFSPLSLLKNPMILIGVFALVVTVGMPKLLENMDPEMRAEFEKQSRAGPLSGASRSALAATNPAAGPGGAGGFDLAGWMAGTTSPSTGAGSGSGSSSQAGAGAADFRGGSVTSGREGGSGGGSRRRG